jgi:hypothetical protein
MYKLEDIKSRELEKFDVAKRIITIVSDMENMGTKNSKYIDELSLYYFYYYDIYKLYEKRITFILENLVDVENGGLDQFGIESYDENELIQDMGDKHPQISRLLKSKAKKDKVKKFNNKEMYDTLFLFKNFVEITKYDFLLLVPNKETVREYTKNLKDIFGGFLGVHIRTEVECNVNNKSKSIFVLTPDKVMDLCKKDYCIKIDYMIWEQSHMLENAEVTDFILDMILKKINRSFPEISYIITDNFFENFGDYKKERNLSIMKTMEEFKEHKLKRVRDNARHYPQQLRNKKDNYKQSNGYELSMNFDRKH